MLAASDAHEIEVVELTAEQEHEYLQRESMRLLNIGGADEFARRWHAGEYCDNDDPRLTQVAMLLPDAGVGHQPKLSARSSPRWRTR